MKFIYFLLSLPLFKRCWLWVIKKMPFALPVERLRETQTLLAFLHPKPAYPFHVVLIPRENIPSLMALKPDESLFLKELFSTVQSLVTEYHLEEKGYRLIVNGGENQDFPHLHFHLIA